MTETPTRAAAKSPAVVPVTPAATTATPVQLPGTGRPSLSLRRGSNPGKAVLLRIKLFPYVESGAQSTMLEVTSDMYFSDVLDMICKRLHFDKNLYVLRLPGTSIMIPPSRRVESLQGRTELEVIRKNTLEALTVGAASASGTPSNSGTSLPVSSHKKRKKLLLGGDMGDRSDLVTNASYQKYIVWRRQPIFGRHERVLAIDGDYIHLMPSDQKTMYDPSNAKTSSIFIGAIIRAKQSRKIPQNFKVGLLLRSCTDARFWC